VKSLLAAFAFLTRFPVGKLAAFDAADVARSAGLFPFVGFALGAVSWAAAAATRGHLPPAVLAVLLIVLDVLLTGALHYDALADSADGFGGGKDRDDILRIMRDHSIGSYGGVALATLVALKVTAYSALLGGSQWTLPLIFIPALSRWSILVLAAMLPYARPSESVAANMGRRSLWIGSAVLLAGLILARWFIAGSLRAGIAVLAVIATTVLVGQFCRSRIGGITGDTLGANLQISECAALLVFLWKA
jgi:adenosylcobinamide-GDP ribazoletransferase